MKQTILIVDDDRSILEATEIIVGDAGYKAVTLDSAIKIEGNVRKIMPDLIILDNLIAGRSGVEACRSLKQLKDLKHIPIILFSAGRGLDTLAKEACADGHLEKPFDIDELLALVSSHLDK